MQVQEKKINFIFYVTDTAGLAILGLKACTALKRVLLHCTLKTSQPDQAGPTSSLNISAQHSDISRRSANYIESHVPIEVQSSIRSKQDLMEMYPECLNSTVKPSGHQKKKWATLICLCFDPKDLRKAINREHHSIPIVERKKTQVNRCKALQQAGRSKWLLECKIRQKIIFNNLQYVIRQVPLP